MNMVGHSGCPGTSAPGLPSWGVSGKLCYPMEWTLQTAWHPAAPGMMFWGHFLGNMGALLKTYRPVSDLWWEEMNFFANNFCQRQVRKEDVWRVSEQLQCHCLLHSLFHPLLSILSSTVIWCLLELSLSVLHPGEHWQDFFPLLHSLFSLPGWNLTAFSPPLSCQTGWNWPIS